MSRVFGHALDIVSGAMSNPRATGSVKLSMKRFFSALAGLLALGWSGMAFAQATVPLTGCPMNFTCAFSAAETLATGTVKGQGTPGQPDIYVGYLAFDSASNVAMAGEQNFNGSPTSFSLTGTCKASTSASTPAAIITLSDKSQLSFVLDSLTTANATLLEFILTNDASTSATANYVRVGTCHKLI